jgi:Putative beta-lactamase-inhibitor-like, PepSY-like
MKKLTAITCALMGMFASCSNPTPRIEVPEVVLSKFKALYSTTDKVEWEKEDGKYEASFILEQKETTVVFLQDGMVEQTEKEMDLTVLPAAITDYVKQSLGGKEIKEVTQIADLFGGVTWEVEVDRVDYLFSPDGKLLSQEEPEKEDDDK